MTASQIVKIGADLVKEHDTRDPFVLAENSGAMLIYGEDFGKLKGMYQVIKGIRFIFLNKDLDENTMKIVCAHELGHDMLHRHLATSKPLNDNGLFNSKVKTEHEANVFAAEILIPDEELFDYIYNYEFTAEQIAEAMNTNANLIALKIKHFKNEGHDLIDVEHRSDFLKF